MLAKETTKFSEYPEFNARLTKIKSDVRDIYRELLNDEIVPTNQLLKQKLDKRSKLIGQDSKYNIFSKLKDSPQYFIVNLLSGSADILDTDVASQIINNRLNEKTKADLIQNGYLVNGEEEEKLIEAGCHRFGSKAVILNGNIAST